MQIMDSDIFYKKYIEKDFEEYYVPHMFENVCRQYLIRKNKAGEIEPVIENIGKYFYDNPEKRTKYGAYSDRKQGEALHRRCTEDRWYPPLH